MGSTVRDDDRGARRLEEALDELARDVTLTVGIHEDAGAAPHGPGGKTIADVAAGVEFGNAERAPRSFVRAPVDERRDELGTQLAAAGARVVGGESIDEAFGRVGEALASEMRARAPSGTGATRAAIEARVHRGGVR